MMRLNRVVIVTAGIGLMLGMAGGCANVQPARTAVALDPIEVSMLRERALEQLMELSSDANPQVRANTIEALSRARQRLEPVVASGLADRNEGVRSVAATIAGKEKLVSLAASVRPMLNDESAFVRASAAFALHRFGEDVDLTLIGQLLLTDPSPQVRSHAAYLLGELGERSAVGLLKEGFRTAMPRASAAKVRLLRLQIAEALVKLGEDGHVEFVRAALYPSRPEELEAAALAVQILGEVQDRRAIDQLISLSAHRDKGGATMPAEIRLGVAWSLAAMGLDQGAFLADEYADSDLESVRAQAASVYGRTGQMENLGKLEVMLGDESAMVQVAAAGAVIKVVDQTVRRARAAANP